MEEIIIFYKNIFPNESIKYNDGHFCVDGEMFSFDEIKTILGNELKERLVDAFKLGIL